MKVKTQTTTSNNLFTRLSNTKGRFFGLYLKTGETLNAQFRNQTESYLTVYDRNAKSMRKVRKTSVVGASV